MGGQPVPRALALGQAAVQGRHQRAGEARAHAGFQLRRQVDLRHQDQDLCRFAARRRLLQHARGGMQVDLGLAAAGDAVQQVRRKALGVGDGVGGLALLRIQRRRGARRLGGRCRLLFRQFLQRPLQGHRLGRAQVFRQAGQHHLAQRPLIILGGKSAQRQPGRRQRRQFGAQRQHAFQLVRRQCGSVLEGDDHAHRFAAAERHQRQLSDLRRRRIRGRRLPAVIEGKVKRCIERDFEDALFHDLM